MQQALFGRGTPGFDRKLAGIRRLELSEGAWVEHHLDWVCGHEQIFRELAGNVPWQRQRRIMYERQVDVPRLVSRAPTVGGTGRFLHGLAERLAQRYQRSFESISLAQYRDGKDSVAFHGDKVGRLANDCIVATVSVGAPRRFLLKPNAGGTSLAFDLGWGDLFVMGGTCQRTWQHAVPKRTHADPRISIMFRPAIPESAA
jgi:alkylated DNA repair dioxygenase AlkB